MTQKEAYLDYNATSPMDPQVLEAMLPFFGSEFGNASSIHQKGQRARHAIEISRESVAEILEVEPGDILFTSGGTESDNLAIKGVMQTFRDSKRNHLVVSAIEHQAVLEPAKLLRESGFEVTVAPVSMNGIVDKDFLRTVITDKTALVSLMHVNNETGVIQPIEAVVALAHAKGALFHTDAVQSFGKLPLTPETQGIDLLSLSAHKICGPKGIGALYLRKGLKIKSLLQGGHQEKNIRPGTESVAHIVGLGKAVELVAKCSAEESKRVKELRDRLSKGLESRVGDLLVNGDPDQRIYNTLNVSFEGLQGEALLVNFDLAKVYASTGSACTAGSIEPSHVLVAMGLPEKRSRAAVRFSLGRFTQSADVDYALDRIPPIVERLRKSSIHKQVTE